jgi:hypothetical protein
VGQNHYLTLGVANSLQYNSLSLYLPPSKRFPSHR